MTTEDRTKPIRDLLSALGTVSPTQRRPTLCGGALVPVTRETERAIDSALSHAGLLPN